ncbi:MAG: hypothetical protein GC164_08730 [Phycisphaera sp.]|nr:hypothetical protein [Phycisphaera sp.]
MRVYAGIDEAGYGPMFGPLVVGRSVFAVDSQGDGHFDPDDGRDNWRPCDLWAMLRGAVSAKLDRKAGKIAVNDSKKLHTKAAGVRHLERGVLAFLHSMTSPVASVDRLLDALGARAHRDGDLAPWYAPCDARPWEPLPRACTVGEVAVARGMLNSSLEKAGVRVLDMGAAVVFEDRFNQMVAATRSKAATSFTFVAMHLAHIWEQWGQTNPVVVVDRQSGRTRYRELLATTLPGAGAMLRIIEENPCVSAYEARSTQGPDRRMTVRFMVDAEQHHLPVALASMVSKYTRELLMHRFQNYFAHVAPTVKPTAGYASDAKRFWEQIEPILPRLRIEPARLLRMS